MTSILNDTFTGAAGTLDGHTPDSSSIGSTWITSATPHTGGMLLTGSGTITADDYYGSDVLSSTADATYSFDGVTVSELTLSFDFTSASDIGTIGTSNRACLTVEPKVNGRYVKAAIQGTYSSGSMLWSIQAGSGGTPVDITGNMIASTQYECVLTIQDGVQSLTIKQAGGSVFATATNTLAYTNTNGLENIEIRSAGEVTMSSFSIDVPGGSTAELIAPSAVLVAAGGPIPPTNLIAPSPTLIGYFGGSGLLSAPSPHFSATGHNSAGENSFSGTAPSPTLVSFGGSNSALAAPSARLDITGTFTGIGNATLVCPTPTIFAAGSVSGSANTTLQSPMGQLVGFGGAVCSITLTGRTTIQATGTTGGTARAMLTAPLFSLVASGTEQNHGEAILAAPMGYLGGGAVAYLVAPGFKLTAIGSATVAVSYEAYALNLKHTSADATDELTRFTNYPFDRIVRYKNSYFGMNATGLYLLEGTTDDAAPITYSVKTKLTDFGTDQKKTPEAAVFGGRLGPDATVTVYTGETEDDVYAYTTPRGQDVQNYRQKFGKGLKARYYAFGIQGDGAMALDTVSFDIATLKRRI